ncbi:MAG: radical SAM protein [Cytophagales bacterium]|nr:radical SAM protein [Armatimonadota bacterium]
MNLENVVISEWGEETTGLCPACLRTVPAVLRREPDNTIWITQNCSRHGESRALLASDADEYLRFRTYVPGRVSGACCGPGEVCAPGDGPPTCVLLLEITQACNLRCPTCYADAHGHDFLTVAEAKGRLDTFFRAQPRLDMLMLSGGEPTIHPHFSEILELALSYPIGRILVNTNGLRLNQSEALVSLLHEHRARVELYFSFASFRPEVHERLYGRDLVAIKQAAMERAREARILMTLVPTVERGVNDGEIGDLYRYALSMDNINGMTFQPVMDNGRYENRYDAADRLTLTGVLTLLAEQTNGALVPSDFVGLPCSHPDCCVLTFGFLDARREVITPLPRHLDVARYLDLFADRITFEGILGGAARRVWSDVSHLRGGQTMRDLAVLFARGGLRDALPLLNKPEEIGRRLFRVAVKPFMDAQTYDHKRIDQCCTKIVNEKGEAVSFCEYNVFHRGRKPKSGAMPLMMAK